MSLPPYFLSRYPPQGTNLTQNICPGTGKVGGHCLHHITLHIFMCFCLENEKDGLQLCHCAAQACWGSGTDFQENEEDV